MLKGAIRLLWAILGLTGLGIIVAEVLGKWQFLGDNTNPFWIVLPIICLFFGYEFVNSKTFHNNQKLTKQQTRRIIKCANAILIILSIMILMSIPFIWFGTVEELAGRSGGGYRP